MTTAAGYVDAVESMWLRRVRSIAGIATIWAALHFIVGGLFRRAALGEPHVLLNSSNGPLLGFLTAGILIAGGWTVARVIGSHDPVRVFFLLGFAVALWLLEDGRQSGTMDQWLIANHATPGPPDGRPYWLLIPDYIALLVVVIAIIYLNSSRSAPASGVLQRLGYGRSEKGGNEGLAALMVCIAAGLLLLLLLMGARYGVTYRLQVYFAVFVSFWISTAIAAKVTGVQQFAFYWPAPVIVGIGGLVLAGFRPGFPPPYDAVNSLPAWAPARGLPLEMTFLGIMGVCQSLKMLRHGRHAGEGGA